MDKYYKESAFYKTRPQGVQCLICPHNCMLRDGMTGNCRARIAKGDKLYSMAYGNPCSVNVDPIEKKPLYHFLPASSCLSVATAGCNLSCKNCQNCEISQRGPGEIPHYELFPEQVAGMAIAKGCDSIAYTYTEPTVFYEYMLDTACIARSMGIKNVMVSNGYINEGPLRALAKKLDAANIDVKSFSGETYKKMFGGSLQPVLNTLQTLKEEGVWLEITTLIIPGHTDQPGMLREMCSWLVGHGFADTPLHFSRFHPMHELASLAATPLSTLEMAAKIAMDAGILFVYIGNVPGTEGQHTRCPGCGKIIIKRPNDHRDEACLVSTNQNWVCGFCGVKIPGIFGKITWQHGSNPAEPAGDH